MQRIETIGEGKKSKGEFSFLNIGFIYFSVSLVGRNLRTVYIFMLNWFIIHFFCRGNKKALCMNIQKDYCAITWK